MRWRTLASTLLASALVAGTPVVAYADDGRSDIQAALDAMVGAGTPGAIARVQEGGRSWTLTSGVADQDTAAPVPREARFRAASLTKSLISTVVLQLVRDGEVTLDQPVGRWLPDVVTGADEITVRQLLNHTSGLADYMSAPEFTDPAIFATRSYTPRQLIATAERLGPVAQPGERFSYANTGYIVLGLLIEKVTGHSVGTELNRRILRPLGMTQSSFPLRERRLPRPHATGYYVADPAKPTTYTAMTEIDPSFEWAAFALVSSARDLNAFARALFSGRLLPDALLTQMRQGVPTGLEPFFPHYGLGLESVGLTCGERWGGTGQTVGYQTFVFADPDGSRVVTLSMNVSRLNPRDPQAGPLILAAINVVNEYFCGEPFTLPGQSSGRSSSA